MLRRKLSRPVSGEFARRHALHGETFSIVASDGKRWLGHMLDAAYREAALEQYELRARSDRRDREAEAWVRGEGEAPELERAFAAKQDWLRAQLPVWEGWADRETARITDPSERLQIRSMYLSGYQRAAVRSGEYDKGHFARQYNQWQRLSIHQELLAIGDRMGNLHALRVKLSHERAEAFRVENATLRQRSLDDMVDAIARLLPHRVRRYFKVTSVAILAEAYPKAIACRSEREFLRLKARTFGGLLRELSRALLEDITVKATVERLIEESITKLQDLADWIIDMVTGRNERRRVARVGSSSNRGRASCCGPGTPHRWVEISKE